MKTLILGGTLFLGRHIAQAALARGHEVTLFNRGRTNPGLFPGAETLRGDRDGGLQPLAGRSWDAVIDTSGYLPRVVRQSAALLRDAVDRYVFISSISVYSDPSAERLTEESPLERLADDSIEDVKQAYGALKARCERVVGEALPGRALIVRPGLIVGPHDPSGRFTWWVRRVAEGGEVLAPADPERPVQLIDARDLAGWLVTMVEGRGSGTFNATGPREKLTMRGLLDACAKATGGEARFDWVDEEFLTGHGVQPWTGLPLWLPQSMSGMLKADISRAVAAGLVFRPLEATAAETLAWDRARTGLAGEGEARDPGIGIDREREKALLDAWCAGRRPEV